MLLRQARVARGCRAYARPQSTEVLINSIVGPSVQELIGRGSIRDSKRADCLPPEVLVHVRRLAHCPGEEHRSSLESLGKLFPLDRESLIDPSGEILAELPFSWVEAGTRRACFREAPSPRRAQRLEDARVRFITPGQLPGYLSSRHAPGHFSNSGGAPISRTVESPRVASPLPRTISTDEARVLLTKFRDEVMHVEFPPDSTSLSLLSDEMLELLLHHRPRSPPEFKDRIPLDMRQRTQQGHLSKCLEKVLDIVRRVKADE